MSLLDWGGSSGSARDFLQTGQFPGNGSCWQPRREGPISTLWRRSERRKAGLPQPNERKPGRIELSLMASLSIKVVPGAKQSRVVGRYGDAFKLQVSAPPEGGKAN